MNAKVLDYYRAKAKRVVNKTFKEYGTLPGGNVHDLIFVHINSQRVQLGYWQDIYKAATSAEMQRIAKSAVEECERLIIAMEVLETEYKLHHDNDLPYTQI